MAYSIDCFMTKVHFFDKEKKYLALAKKMKLQGVHDPWVTPSSGATTHTWRKGAWIHSVICLAPCKSKAGRIALLAHECLHSVQAIRDQLRSGPLSDETEAWLLQSIFQNGMEELGI